MKTTSRLVQIQMVVVTILTSMLSLLSAPSVLAQGLQPGEIKGARGFAANIGTIISSGLQMIMAIAALLVFAYLVWGGIEWITAGDDKGKVEKARNKITQAVIGLVVLAASYAILSLGLKFLGLESLTNSFTLVEPIETLN